MSRYGSPSREALDRYASPGNFRPIREREFEGEREKALWPKTHRELVAVYRERSRPVAFEEITTFYTRISGGFLMYLNTSSHLGT
jgi:hypothetical protein